MKMKEEKSISKDRATVSIDSDIFGSAKTYSNKKSMKFSNLVEMALEHYLASKISDVECSDGDCFVALASEFSGIESADNAKDALEHHGIKQSHFLGHIIKEASEAIKGLEDGQDWHDIKFYVPKRGGGGGDGDGPEKERSEEYLAIKRELEKLKAEREKSTKTQKAS